MFVIVRDPVVETSETIPIVIGAILVLLAGCVIFNRKILSQEQMHKISVAVRNQCLAEEQKEKDKVSQALKKVRGRSTTPKAKPTPKKVFIPSQSEEGFESDLESMDDGSSGSDEERGSGSYDEEAQNRWSSTHSADNKSKQQSPRMQHRSRFPISTKGNQKVFAIANPLEYSRGSRELLDEDGGNGRKAPVSVVSHRNRRGHQDLDAFLSHWKLMSLSQSLAELGYQSLADLVRDWNCPGPRAVLTVCLQEPSSLNHANYATSS
jgi:hypothetical protein